LLLVHVGMTKSVDRESKESVDRESKESVDRESRESKDVNASDQPPFWRWFFGNIFLLVRQFGSQAIWISALMFCVREGRIAITAFAGRNSTANVIMQVAAHLNVTIAVSIAVTGLATGFWANEYRRHRNTRERLTKRITQLEKHINPERSSSLLTTQGLTSPGDL